MGKVEERGAGGAQEAVTQVQHIMVECLYWGVKEQGEGQIVLGQSKGVDKSAENGILACGGLANLVESELVRNPGTHDSEDMKAYVIQLRYLDDGRALLVTSWMQTAFGRVGLSSLGIVLPPDSLDFIHKPAGLAMSMVGRTCPTGDVPALRIAVSPGDRYVSDRETPVSSALERDILIELLEQRTNDPARTAFCSIEGTHLPMTATLADLCYQALPKPDRCRGFMTHCPRDEAALKGNAFGFAFRLRDRSTNGLQAPGTQTLSPVLRSITKLSTLWRVIQAIRIVGEPLASIRIESWQSQKIGVELESGDFDSLDKSLEEGGEGKMCLVDVLTPNIIKHLISRYELDAEYLARLIERLCAELAINKNLVPLLWELLFRVDESTQHFDRIERAMEKALGLNAGSTRK